MSKQTLKNVRGNALEEAKKLVLKAEAKKIEMCTKEVNDVLAKYGMVINSGAPQVVPKV